MKKLILKLSLTLVMLALAVWIGGSLFIRSPDTAVRSASIAWSLILGSIGTFFIGVVSPKE